MKKTTLLFLTALVLGPAQRMDAVTIVQGAGDLHIAWEAEQFNSLSEWVQIFDGGASGGVGLLSTGLTNGTVPGTDTLDYLLQFTNAGPYTLYTRQSSPTTSANSFFSPLGLSVAPSVQEHIFPLTGAGTYDWYESSLALTAGALGVPLSFQVAGRESGTILDRFVLSTSSGLTPRQLDTLSNSATVPEAGTMSLLATGLGLLAIGLRRKRSA